MGVSRRAFCVGAAAMAGSVALAGCAGNSGKTGADTTAAVETIDADVAVIGSGLAGLSCALSAAQNGAKVVLVEKSPSWHDPLKLVQPYC